MRKALVLLACLASAAPAFAAVPSRSAAWSGPSFFVSLLVGFCLAVAFQIVLTNLSVAAGIGALKAGPNGRESAPGEEKRMRAISARFGLWAAATSSLSLFGACWFAARLFPRMGGFTGAVLGLAVWSLFVVTLTSFEIGSAASLFGLVVSSASFGVRGLRKALEGLFFPSSEASARTEREVSEAVREEFFGDREPVDLPGRLRKMVRELKPRPVDTREIRKELAKLFTDSELRSVKVQGERVDYDKLVSLLHAKYGSLDRRKPEAQSGRTPFEQAVDAGLRMAGISAEEADRTRKAWEEYLRQSGKEELSPENIKREIEALMKDPQGASALPTRASEAFNKSTIAKLLSQRQDMTKEDAERTADGIELVIREIRKNGKPAEKSVEDIRGGAVARVRDYLNSVGRPELRYDTLRDELERLFHHPEEKAEDILRNLRVMDRVALRAALSSNPAISPRDSDHLLQRLETARNEALEKAKDMKVELERRMESFRAQARSQTEKARKIAAEAAWWAFATAVVSGVAAVCGGWLASI